MSKFIRKYDDIEIISKTELFKLLLSDIKNGDVFPAVRNNRIDFYHKGGKLFGFEKGKFYTHKKYAAAVEFKSDYISENNLETAEIITNFEKQYDRIKENCTLYAGVEGSGIWHLLKKASFFKKINIVVLDTQISFKTLALEEEKSQDRIDLLLFSKKKKQLKFVEAKHFTNKELWAKEKSLPKVISQIERYNEQIVNKHDEIIEAYQKYITIMNKLFNLKLPIPESIHPGCALYIFGFDKDQLTGRFNRLLKSDGSLKGVKYYSIGDPKGIKIENLCKKIFKK